MRSLSYLAMLCLRQEGNNWCLWTLEWEDMFGLRQAVVPATMFGRKLKTFMVGRGPWSEGKTRVEVLCLGSKVVRGRNDPETWAPWLGMAWDLQSDMLWEGLREKGKLHGTRDTPLAPRLKPKRRAFLWGSACTTKGCSDGRLWRDLQALAVFCISSFLSCSCLGDVDITCLFFSPTVRFSLPERRQAETVDDLWRDCLRCLVSASSDDDWFEGNWMMRFGLEVPVGRWIRGLDRLMGAPSTNRFTPTYWGTSTAA